MSGVKSATRKAPFLQILFHKGVTNYVKQKYPHTSIVSIERGSKGYDVKLNNHKHFQLNKNFKPTKFKDAD
jgi:hypothetical protein